MASAQAVFISYSRSDRSFVSIAIQLLQAGGASVFYDATSIEFGDRWEVQLQRAINQCERVLVFWSAAAASSAWVEREWREALALSKRIVPMQLDQTPMPHELAQFQGITGLLETLREALDARPSPPPPRAVPSTPSGPGQKIPDDWDPFAPDPFHTAGLPITRSPAPMVPSPAGRAQEQDPFDGLLGGGATSGDSASDPFIGIGVGGQGPELERGRRFTRLLFGEVQT